MKNVACLVATLLAGGAFIAGARADDPSSQVLSTTDKLSMQDPDGTPFIVTHPETKPASQTEKSDADKGDASNQDWLLRSFEQVQQKNAKSSGSQSDNLYYRIASDKNLSKLAGINPIDIPVDPGASLKTGTLNKEQSSLSLRPSTLSSSPTSSLAPLITPLAAADSAGLHNFYNSPPATVPAEKKTDINPADMDIPGKVAADSDPLAKDTLSFDSLPDDPESSKPLHDPNASKALPLTTNVAQIQKLTDASLTAPGTVKTTTSPNVSTLQLKLAADPPAPKLVAPPTAGRMPIANPYSILDR